MIKTRILLALALLAVVLAGCARHRTRSRHVDRFEWVDVQVDRRALGTGPAPPTLDSVFVNSHEASIYAGILAKFPGLTSEALLDSAAAARARDLFAHADSVDPNFHDPGLDLTWRVHVPGAFAADSVAVAFRALRSVETTFVEPILSPPFAGCTPAPAPTPATESDQVYLLPSPTGIGAKAAWERFPGTARGRGVSFVDVDERWDPANPDLPSFTVLSGTNDLGDLSAEERQSLTAHGTPTLGIVGARNDGQGCIGIAPDCKAYVASYRDANWNLIPLTRVLIEASAAPRPTVVLIEVQSSCPARPDDLMPVECDPNTAETIRALVDNDVIVVESAGNDPVDLEEVWPQVDNPTGLSSTTTANGVPLGHSPTGAVLVASASSPTNPNSTHYSLCSNFGRPIACFAQGQGVAAPGDREFNGTSAASAIVAGAAVVLAGHAHATGHHLKAADARAILSSEAYGQRAVVAPRVVCRACQQPNLIGVMPNLVRVLAAPIP